MHSLFERDSLHVASHRTERSYWISIELRFHASVYNLATLIDIVFPIARRLYRYQPNSPSRFNSAFDEEVITRLVMSHRNNPFSLVHQNQRINVPPYKLTPFDACTVSQFKWISSSRFEYRRGFMAEFRPMVFRPRKFRCLVKSVRMAHAATCVLISRREIERPFVDQCKIEGRAAMYISSGVPTKCRTVYIRITEHSVNCRS